MKYPPGIDENKYEQAQIKNAILAALPEGVYYHNLIIVLVELTKTLVEESLLQLVIFRSKDSE